MTDRKQKLRSNIWKHYLFQTFAGMFFSIPVIVLFWQENGLSLTEIMVLQSIYSIIVVLLEIPTGYFADLYDRKKSLLFSGIASTLGIAIYSISSGFWHFLVAEALLALGISLSSGALSAFIYDTLVDLGEEKKYKKVWGNGIFFAMIGMAVANIAGGFIADIDLRYTIYASIPMFALMIPTAMSMHEPERHKLVIKSGYLREIIKVAKNTFYKNKKLKWLVIYSGAVFTFVQAALWLYQPYFKISGLDVAYFGLVFASFQVVAAISSKYADKVEGFLGKKGSLISLFFLLAIGYFLMSNFVFLFSFAFAYFHQFVRSFRNVVMTDYINQEATSDTRATVLSMESFVGNIMYAATIPIIGYIADAYSLLEAISVLAGTTVLLGLAGVFMFIAARSKKAQDKS